MAGFKYFLADVTEAELVEGDRLRPEVLARYGLERTLADLEKRDRDCALSGVAGGKGPDGRGGLVLTPRGPSGAYEASLQYRPPAQGWLPAVAGNVWIGWETVAPPEPQDLARKTRYAGYDVRDESGGLWHIPVARTPQLRYGFLPQSYTFGAGGTPVGHLKAQARELWERAGQLWDVYASIFGREAIASGEATLPREIPEAWYGADWLLQQAVWILGVNYRVGPLEINALFELGRPILDDGFKQAVCQATCDFDFALELQKKTKGSSSSGPAPAGSSSTPGDGAGSATTSPPLPDSGSPES